MTDLRNLGAVQIGADESRSGGALLERINDDIAHRFMHLLSVANDLHLAYGTAIRKLRDADIRAGMIRLDKAHNQCRAQLAEFISSLGQSPSDRGDLHGLWDRVRVVIGELRGDEGILRAMAKNEADLASAYRELRGMPGLPDAAHDILEEGLVHEAQHRDFYDRALGRFVG